MRNQNKRQTNGLFALIFNATFSLSIKLHIHEHTIKCSYTHAHMHACSIHLHPGMKIIKIKAIVIYEKTKQIYTCNFTSSGQSEQGKFLVIKGDGNPDEYSVLYERY